MPKRGIALGKMFRDSGLVDFLNVIRGRIHTDPRHDGCDPDFTA